MKLAKLPKRVRETFEGWACSRTRTAVSFEPDGEGGLDIRIDSRLSGHLWVDSEGHLHINPVRHVAISKQALRDMIDEALRSQPE